MTYEPFDPEKTVLKRKATTFESLGCSIIIGLAIFGSILYLLGWVVNAGKALLMALGVL